VTTKSTDGNIDCETFCSDAMICSAAPLLPQIGSLFAVGAVEFE
jgi:hypothetical protein